MELIKKYVSVVIVVSGLMSISGGHATNGERCGDISAATKALALIKVIYNQDCVAMGKFIEEQDIDVNNADGFGSTPLLAAINIQDSAMVRALIDKDADVNKPGLYGKTPLSVAVEYKNGELIGMLLSAGARSDVDDVMVAAVIDSNIVVEINSSSTVAVVAEAMIVDDAAAEVIVEAAGVAEADVNNPGLYGRTSLSVAVEYSNRELIGTLVAAGAVFEAAVEVVAAEVTTVVAVAEVVAAHQVKKEQEDVSVQSLYIPVLPKKSWLCPNAYRYTKGFGVIQVMQSLNQARSLAANTVAGEKKRAEYQEFLQNAHAF